MQSWSNILLGQVFGGRSLNLRRTQMRHLAYIDYRLNVDFTYVIDSIV